MLLSIFALGPAGWTSRCMINAGGVKDVPLIQGFECIFANIVVVATALAGLALFIMLISGGFKYLTSGGEPKATEQAQQTITHAILGLVVIVAGYLILKFLAEFTGLQSILTFIIPGP